MTEKKLDRRIRRTRRQLSESLIALVMEKGYDAVTIQDLTDHADLSRATFYLHFADKDELLVDTLETMFDDLVASLDEHLTEDSNLLFSDIPSLFVFTYIQEYSKLYQALLSERSVSYAIYRSVRYLSTVIEALLESHFQEKDLPPVPIPIIAQHLAGSLFTMILWWVENDMPHPKEYMAQTFRLLAMPGVLNAIDAPLDLAQFKPEKPESD